MANTQIWNQQMGAPSAFSSSSSLSPPSTYSLPFISYPHQLVNNPTQNYQQLLPQSNSTNNVTNNNNSSFVNLQLPLSSSNTTSQSYSSNQYLYHSSNNSGNNSNISEDATSGLNQKSNNTKIFTPLCHLHNKNNVGQRYIKYNRHPSFPKRKNKSHKNNISNTYLVEHKRVHQIVGPHSHATLSPLSSKPVQYGYGDNVDDTCIPQANELQYQDQPNYRMLSIRNNGNIEQSFQQHVNNETNFYQQQSSMQYFQNLSQFQQLQSLQQIQQLKQFQQPLQYEQLQQQQLLQHQLQPYQQQHSLFQQGKRQLPQNYNQQAIYTRQNNRTKQSKMNYQYNIAKNNNFNDLSDAIKNTQSSTIDTQFNNKRSLKHRQSHPTEKKQYQVELTLPDSLKNQEPEEKFHDKRKKIEISSNNCQIQIPSRRQAQELQKQETNEMFLAQVNGFVRKSKYNKPLSAFVRSYDVSRGNRFIPILPRHLRKDWV